MTKIEKGAGTGDDAWGSQIPGAALSGFVFSQKQQNNRNVPVPINRMTFFTSAIGTLQTLVIAIGAGLAVWGAINLLEGYGNDNPGARSQGIKQLMAGGGVALIGTQLIPLLATLFNTP